MAFDRNYLRSGDTLIQLPRTSQSTNFRLTQGQSALNVSVSVLFGCYVTCLAWCNGPVKEIYRGEYMAQCRFVTLRSVSFKGAI